MHQNITSDDAEISYGRVKGMNDSSEILKKNEKVGFILWSKINSDPEMFPMKKLLK